MFRTTIRLFLLLSVSSLFVHIYGNISVVVLTIFGYEVHVNLLLFMILNFLFIKLMLNSYSLISFITSKITFKKKVKL